MSNLHLDLTLRPVAPAAAAPLLVASALPIDDLDQPAAPAAIQATAQFTSLCPASAVVMRRGLA
jgi:hypothetical protein